MCQTAKQAWDALARTYAAKSSARTLLLEKEFNQLRKRLDEPLPCVSSESEMSETNWLQQGNPSVMRRYRAKCCWDSLVHMRFWPLYYRPLRTLSEGFAGQMSGGGAAEHISSSRRQRLILQKGQKSVISWAASQAYIN